MDLNQLKELLNSTSQMAEESEETEAFQDQLDGKEPFSFFSFPMADAIATKKKVKAKDDEEQEDDASEVTSITFSDDSMDDDDDSVDSEDAIVASPPRHKRKHKKSPSPAPSLSTSLVTAAAAATAGALIESNPATIVAPKKPGSSWKLSLMIVLAVVAGLYVIFQLKKTITQLEDDLKDEKALQLSESDIEKIISKKMVTQDQIEKIVQQQLETKFEYVEE
jgi:hypothetical protein